MSLYILQHYNGPNINQNTLLFLTCLLQKTYSALSGSAQSDLKLIITLQRMKKFFKKWTQTTIGIPDMRLCQKRGVKSHACVPLRRKKLKN